MMLLDTHALVWLGDDDPQLGKRARGMISDDDELHMSVISYWEAGMLARKGRLTFAMSVKAWFDRLAADARINVASVTPAIAADAGAMPPPIHGDPADRLMIATARALGCPLITSDRKILDYAEAGHLRAIDARR